MQLYLLDPLGMLQPREPRSTDQMRSVYENNLDEIERVVSWIAGRSCLGVDDGDEFRSWVHVKLIEGDFRVLRSHAGRASLATFLVTVVQNLARDYRSKHWGRWRPSARAEQFGVVAVQLETLIYRDGFSVDVATEMLRRHYGVRLSADELSGLAERLPQREARTVEGGERVERIAGRERTEDGLMRSEGESTMDEARTALDESLAELDVEDRLILRMHYESGLTVAAIAGTLDVNQRQLYTRRDRCLRTLRASLESRGLDAERIFDALQWTDSDRRLDFQADLAEAGELEPSNPYKEDDSE